jgi:bifunctional non-homologous end joining protein LigD
VLYVDHVVGRGEEFCETVARGGLPGAIAKRADSTWAAGASEDWRAIPAESGGAKPKRKSVTESLGTPTGERKIVSRVKITNRNKVYWPQEGITKGELLDYYDRVAEVILPYLRNRPVHMLRYPDGIDGKSFYHKNVTGRIPDWVETVWLGEKEGEEVRYVVCNDRDTLIHLINLGSIDLHPWLSRIDELEMPDWAIVDLDPSSSDFTKVVRIATTVGKILRGAGLRPYLKTSGASGLHIHIPLVRQYGYDQAKMFCEAVARMTVQEHRDVATVERVVANRESKVYVDFGQNRREQTVVPPWVVRPVPGATVSTPLDWDELDGQLHPSRFDMQTAIARLDQLGDLFRGTITDPQDLTAAIEALSQR